MDSWISDTAKRANGRYQSIRTFLSRRRKAQSAGTAVVSVVSGTITGLRGLNSVRIGSYISSSPWNRDEFTPLLVTP
ncbi:hypothetical protein M0802_010821 [Mischocyttarus mexicanus]|nr:hypothetical protein M0802_010821 [Mischocyttarus mexicanus]